jgi:hypothetical protein
MRLRTILILALAAGSCTALPQEQGKTEVEGDQAGKGAYSRYWKGILVDAACTPSAPNKTAAIQSPDMKSNAARVEESGSAARTDAERRGADREASPARGSRMWTQSEWRSCPATATTAKFGIVLSDGRMVRLDSHGNSLALSYLQTGRRRNQTEVSGKSPEVTARGMLIGDTLRVRSIK